MLGAIFDNVKITGLACAVPDNIVYTEDYNDKFTEKEISRFIKTTGIKSRYLSKGKQCASDLCYISAKKLMEHKGYNPEDIDAIIFITQTPDYTAPSTAFVLQKRLGLTNNCIAFDINLGCSAFPNGVFTIASMIKSKAIKRALLLLGDANLAKTHRGHNIMLFGDVGSACVIESGNDTIKVGISSEGENFTRILQPYPTMGGRFNTYENFENPYGYDVDKCYMAGQDVFLFSITSVPKLFKEFFNEYNCSSDDFDYFLFHQANAMIINHVARKIKAPKEKVPICIDKYANTGGASALLAMVDLCQNENVPDKIKFAASSFGVGLNLGVVSFEMNKEDILPLIYTNDYYEEGYLNDFFKDLQEQEKINNESDDN